MSSPVLAWVFKHSPARGPDRLLHIAMADSARDDGYLSGEEYGSMSHMQEKCNFPSRETLTAAYDWLEQNGQIIVRRRADRGWGKHNEYVIVMGRDRADLIQRLGWPPRLLRSVSQTDVSPEAARSSTTVPPDEDTIDPATERDDAHRGAQAAPPAAHTHQATAPVDSQSRPFRDRSARRTKQRPIGPASDRHQSVLQGGSPSSLSSQQPSHLEVAHQPQGGGDAEPVDEDPMSPPMQAVRQALAALAPDVQWDLTAAQAIELTVHIAAWPDAAGAITEFVAAAAGEIDRFGPPRSARAWRTTWLELRPPEAMPGEPLCTEHAIDGYDVPVRICAECRQRVVQIAT